MPAEQGRQAAAWVLMYHPQAVHLVMSQSERRLSCLQATALHLQHLMGLQLGPSHPMLWMLARAPAQTKAMQIELDCLPQDGCWQSSLRLQHLWKGQQSEMPCCYLYKPCHACRARAYFMSKSLHDARLH